MVALTAQLHIEITFHGPFRIATGQARDGVAVTVNRADPLPASSLKGLMRASARDLFPGRPELIGAVFGASGQASPWHWDSAELTAPPHVEQRARIAIAPETGAVREDFFRLGEEIWATTAALRITQRLPLDAATRTRHTTVLACAAAGVHALGADRRRGWGWVDLRPVSPPLDEDMLTTLNDLTSNPSERPSGGADA